ncbi:alpha-galactosidase [Sulfuriroseicoccus oceanibius]|uniref:Alpha-galactosidase n=1 Tax=Sulfuriroseicoccus oceanibius TaxID=2707525 RepID=A0A6B3LDX1_9BACT|nr:alpha-galactosidase [Sulfuriroseicoccus oceanibius]QQL45026.1 alpha-galactosidase [Sulfuriroseicoccus oceanibius]
MNLKHLVIPSLAIGICSHAGAIDYPGTKPTDAKAQAAESAFTLENNLLSATWTVSDGKVTGPNLTNKETGEVFTSGDSLFSLATKPQAQDPDRIYVGMRKTADEIQAVLSNDGKNWESIGSFPLSELPGKLKAVRIGKTSSNGGDNDYADAGAMGVCEIQEVQVRNEAGTINDLTAKPSSIHKSSREGTSLEIANEQITINANANSATFAEYETPADWTLLSCKIKKGSDKGMSWGPGITLRFDDGSFALLNIREKGQFTLQGPGGERLVNKEVTPSLTCDLTSNAFTLKGEVQHKDTEDGQLIGATFANADSGIHVRWSAELLDGSNYVRQNYTIASNSEITIHGLEFISGSADGAKQIGTVPGSPVASSSLFFGVEMPFTANYFSPDGFRSGFPCNLPLKEGVKYDFASVIGVYPEDQLRRAFAYYMERERSTPYHQFLHYNCWYDLGLNPTRETFSQVIKDYHRELTVERGVKVDSFVMDDGWDDYNAGLWEYNRQKFPNGFDEVSKLAREADSNLGVWISPLGGYSGATERTEHAKKMGLIESTMDLSQPGYYKWFYEKCLGFMKDHGVNYYKWDKAGSGVSPHFMALIQCGRELKQHDPKLFINVTVGTWPSPFWLNHIDCTWRTGTGDVAWMGVGDEREQWLTFRDWGCYEKFVKPAPLYPLNSVMHHGLVAGPHFQGAKVMKAGVKMKNAARSYFGTGANLLELYLTPSVMTEQAWDEVAEAAKWAKANEEILVDSHWVGGDPLKLGVYGWASWSPEKSIITLRNSSDQPRELTIDIAQALEVPKGYAVKFNAKNAYPDQTYQEGEISGETTFKLEGFEVLCLELIPVK